MKIIGIAKNTDKISYYCNLYRTTIETLEKDYKNKKKVSLNVMLGLYI